MCFSNNWKTKFSLRFDCMVFMTKSQPAVKYQAESESVSERADIGGLY